MAQVTMSGRSGDVSLVGLDGLLKALNRAPKDMNSEIRKAARAIGQPLAREIKNAAGSVSPGSQAQARMAAISVQARSDRVVTIKGGGSRVLRTRQTWVDNSPSASGSPRSRVRSRTRKRPLTASDVFFGTEFGSNLPQFPPHAGRKGYYFWPTIRKNMDKVVNEYLDALERVLQKWAAGG